MFTGALYSSYIRLDATLVEPLLRAADYLQMPCLTAACVTYIRSHLVQAAPVEVCSTVLLPLEAPALRDACLTLSSTCAAFS